MEHISASKRCESSRVRFEEGKGERGRSRSEVPAVVTVPWHTDPTQGSSASILLVTLCSQHSIVGPDLESSFHIKWLHLLLVQESHWIFAWAAVGAHWRVTQLWCWAVTFQAGQMCCHWHIEGLYHPLGAQPCSSPVSRTIFPSVGAVADVVDIPWLNSIENSGL